MKSHADELKACQSILALADTLYQSNAEKVHLDTGRHASLAVLGLYAKARKQIDAIHGLASRGYGEDAMILVRSLVNLTIDLGYIMVESNRMEERARYWEANGRVERRKFSQRVGTAPPDEARVDWAGEERLAEEWRKNNIVDRAKMAGLESFYNLPYRHGSSFEHSDSWSASSFLERTPDAIEMRSGPSDRFIDLAILTLVCSVGEIAALVGKFYNFDHTDPVVEMIRTLVKKAFPTEEVPL